MAPLPDHEPEIDLIDQHDHAEEYVGRPPADLLARLDADINAAGGEQPLDAAFDGAIGATMFDAPTSEDASVVVLLPRDKTQLAPSQSLVRIKSRTNGDGRTYLGVVSAGPFAEPDNLRADSSLLVTVTTQGGIFLPPYHGRIEVKLLGEELKDGTLIPPRLRPLPNSPVFILDEQESAKVLKTEGDIRLGLVVGHQDVAVKVPSTDKAVLPRHLAILGTTGGGKSTTISGLIKQAQEAGMAVIVLDVEGEYTALHEPTADKKMLAALTERKMKPGGIPADRMTLYHLIGRDTANPTHPHCRPFSLQFARLSPYSVMEILAMTDAQAQRFLTAYDICKEVMRDLGTFPAKKNAEQERLAMELNEFERGYPRMTIPMLLDIVAACAAKVDRPRRSSSRSKDEEPEPLAINPFSEDFKTPDGVKAINTRLHTRSIPESAISWRTLQGKLGRLNRLKVFFDEKEKGIPPLTYKKMLQPGHVSVVDLSDTGASEMTNLAIADLFCGLQDAQDDAYQAHEEATSKGKPPPERSRVLVIIEEAHEFLSAERIEKMSNLFEQVARIAKRGRKRWLSLAFVTQLPNHLPRQVLSLCNSFILHKITDPLVVQTLRKTVSGIDDGLWDRLPALAPGQAIVSFPHLTRPLLVSMDPTPARLRLID